MTQEDVYRERLEKIEAIVNVMGQHGDIDLGTLTQLRLALDWEPEKNEKQDGHFYHATDDEYGAPMYDRDGQPVMMRCDDPMCPFNQMLMRKEVE